MDEKKSRENGGKGKRRQNNRKNYNSLELNWEEENFPQINRKKARKIIEKRQSREIERKHLNSPELNENSSAFEEILENGEMAEKNREVNELSENGAAEEILKIEKMLEIEDMLEKNRPVNSGKRQKKNYNSPELNTSDDSEENFHGFAEINRKNVRKIGNKRQSREIERKHPNSLELNGNPSAFEVNELSENIASMAEEILEIKKMLENNLPVNSGKRQNYQNNQKTYNSPEINTLNYEDEENFLGLPKINRKKVRKIGGKRQSRKIDRKRYYSADLDENDELWGDEFFELQKMEEKNLLVDGGKTQSRKIYRKHYDLSDLDENDELWEDEILELPKMDEKNGKKKFDGKTQSRQIERKHDNSPELNENDELMGKEIPGFQKIAENNLKENEGTSQNPQYNGYDISSPEFYKYDDYDKEDFLGFPEDTPEKKRTNCFHALEARIYEITPPPTPPPSPPPIPIIRKRRQITRKDRWDENHEFVNNIWQFPALHNRYHADYKNPLVTDRLWLIVSRRMIWSVDKCKRKWRYFKSIFRGCLENNRHHYLESIMKYNVPYMTIFYDMAIPANKRFFPELDEFYRNFSNVIWSSLIDPRAIFEEKERNAMVHLKALIYEGRMRQYKFSQEESQKMQEEQEKQEQNDNGEKSENTDTEIKSTDM